MTDTAKIRIAIVTTHPIQYQIPWFCSLAVQPEVELKVFFGMIPDEHQQGIGFGVSFLWDIPLLEGYQWELLRNISKQPSLETFRGCNTPSIYKVLSNFRPDVVIITGWQSLSLIQALWTCMRLRIPRIMRGESNAMRKRPLWIRLIHKLFLSRFDAFLAIGKANREFYLGCGVPVEKIFRCNYFIDNQWFRNRFSGFSGDRNVIRSGWG
ncbi:MAG TPA: glycosyltransferase [Syntrophales bacterium]|nr:glycosyltransferase [Syntrophales bacterium]